ncbi:MAG: hypothetical protein ACR2MG_02630 [Pyrinomonadaceae bacterium]
MKRFFIFIFIISSGFLSVEAQSVFQLSILQQSIEPLYRKPSKKELKAVAPKPELFEKYAEFLRQPNTGLTKLINDSGCADNAKIVVATDECLKYTMPGAGSSYSFRVENYRIPRLADLIFTENSFQASGILLHGIFVNIGDVRLDKVTLQTVGLKYLLDFQPEVDYAKAGEIDRQLSKGIRKDKFLYRRGLNAVENTTFVLRSIAYDGKYLRAAGGVIYNEFSFDKRRDVIVAFRIVDKDDDGNVTILWKELANKKSPRIKRSQNGKQ